MSKKEEKSNVPWHLYNRSKQWFIESRSNNGTYNRTAIDYWQWLQWSAQTISADRSKYTPSYEHWSKRSWHTDDSACFICGTRRILGNSREVTWYWCGGYSPIPPSTYVDCKPEEESSNTHSCWNILVCCDFMR